MGTTIWLVLLLELCALGIRNEGYGIEARHHPEPHLDNAISNKSPAIDHEHKLLLECQHSDYRTYIKCLKREKRQHDDSDNRRTCLDECLERNCTNHACTRDCYTHCRKRIIEVSSKTIETTYDCANGECHSNLPPNITTNIHIQNILPNITLPACNNSCSGKNNDCNSNACNDKDCNSNACNDKDCNSKNSCCGNNKNCNSNKDGCCNNKDCNSKNDCDSPCKSKEPCTSTSPDNPNNPSKVDINNVINNNFLQQPNQNICPCPGCYCYQWQPQITIGIGLGNGPIGGNCMYSSWPCIQKNPNPVDCSMCNNPFLRYQCSPTCVPIPSPNSTTAVSRQGINSADKQYNGGGYRSSN